MILQNLADPRLGFVTITGVECTDDLEWATVRFSVIGTDAEKHKTRKVLEKSASYMESEVFHRMRIRRMPRIVFELDERAEHASRMSELISEARRSDPDGGLVPTAPASDPGMKEDGEESPVPRIQDDSDDEEPPVEEFRRD